MTVSKRMGSPQSGAEVLKRGVSSKALDSEAWMPIQTSSGQKEEAER